jgi:hypothetical protein
VRELRGEPYCKVRFSERKGAIAYICGSLAARVSCGDVALAAANHLRTLAATCLGAKVVLATGARVIHGSIAAIFFARVSSGDAAIAAANHPRTPAATCLGAEVVIATGAGVICGNLVTVFFARVWC